MTMKAKPKRVEREASLVEAKERILDTAERLFAEHGVQGVSIRDITQAARVNLAAINYYFGHKQGLVAEVFGRRLAPLNQRRLALLDELERASKAKPLTVEAVLEVMIRPAVEQGFAAGQQNKSFLQLIGRSLGEPDEETELLIKIHVAEIANRFDAVILRILPGLTAEELFWPMIFTVGALHYSMLASGKAEFPCHRARKKLNAEGLIERLVAFTAAGMRACAAQNSPEE